MLEFVLSQGISMKRKDIDHPPLQKEKTLSPVQFAATIGLVGGTLGEGVLGHPFRVLKFRQHLYSTGFLETIRNVRLSHISNNILPSALMTGVATSLQYSISKLITSTYNEHYVTNDTPQSISLLSGATSGALSAWLFCPQELVMTQQNHNCNRHKTFFEVARNLYKQCGVRSIYRGISANMLRSASCSISSLSLAPYLSEIFDSPFIGCAVASLVGAPLSQAFERYRAIFHEAAPEKISYKKATQIILERGGIKGFYTASLFRIIGVLIGILVLGIIKTKEDDIKEHLEEKISYYL